MVGVDFEQDVKPERIVCVCRAVEGYLQLLYRDSSIPILINNFERPF